ncbi:MAG TPA: response regulator transcription factor [Puia sp.]|jgi:DNA-binding NarL/FixJ family response regulator
MMIYLNDPLIRIGIVESDPVYLQALESMFSLSPEFELTGVWKDSGSAIREIPGTSPHVVLIDIHLPAVNGIDCIRQLRKIDPDIQFLVFTGCEQGVESVFDAFKAGATGYILKKDGAESLLRSVKELHAGGSPMSRSIARKIVDSLGRPATPGGKDHLLTKREEEVLTLLSEGKMYKEVAIRLGITMETAKKHVKHIYNKLEVQNKMEAVNKWRS